MKELLALSKAESEGPSDQLIIRLLAAVVFGTAVAIVRTVAQPRAKQEAGFRTTLVLLTVLTALVMSVVGDNIARAFGLAGVLAVVRFRTVVEDTRDSAFVIFAMAEGMAVGYGYLVTAAVAIPVVALVVVLARVLGRVGPLAAPAADAMLEVRVKAGSGAEKEVPGVLAKHGTHPRLVAAETTNKEGEGLELRYLFRPTTTPVELVAALKAVNGVDKVGVAVR
jgi:uncharacterized membrane protein YhiD involved in acid resistance